MDLKPNISLNSLPCW